MSFKTFAVPVFGMLTLAALTPATAQTTDQQRSIVTFRHGELMTADGRAIIDKRIVRAANRICSINTGRFFTGRVDAACRDQAMADARQQLAARVASAVGQVQVATVGGTNTAR